MNCKEVAEFLDAFLNGELPRTQRWIFNVHIALCGNCRRYIAGYKRAGHLAKEAMTHEPAQPLPQELIAAILKARGQAGSVEKGEA